MEDTREARGKKGGKTKRRGSRRSGTDGKPASKRRRLEGDAELCEGSEEAVGASQTPASPLIKTEDVCESSLHLSSLHDMDGIEDIQVGSDSAKTYDTDELTDTDYTALQSPPVAPPPSPVLPAAPPVPCATPKKEEVEVVMTVAAPAATTPPVTKAARTPSAPKKKRIVSTSGLLDCILGKSNAPKLFFSQDHIAKDIRGAISLIVAVDENAARQYLDRALAANGYKKDRAVSYTVARLPVYRECCFFLGNIYRRKLEEQIGKEDLLMLDRIKVKDVDKLCIYYGFTDQHCVNTGYVAAATCVDDAYRILYEASSGTTDNDLVGIFGAPEHVYNTTLYKLELKEGTVVSSLFKPPRPM